MAVPAWGQACEDRDGDGYAVGPGDCGTPDCNDSDATVSPDGTEVCNGVDDDCNGLRDDAIECDRTCDNPELFPFVHQISTVDTVTSRRPAMVWTGDGWVVAWEHFYDGACSELRVRRLAADGTPVGDPVVLAGHAGSNIQVQTVDIAWSGEEYAVTWSQATTDPTCFSIDSPIHVLIQVFDREFSAVASARQLDCGEFSSSNPTQVAWGASRFGVVWPKGEVLFNSVSRDGAVFTPCGVSIGPPVLAATPLSPWIAWDGTMFGLVWKDAEPNTNYIDIHSEVYFRRVDEYEASPDASPRRITFDPARSDRPRVTSNDDGWGITWADTRDNSANLNEIYAARLTSDGTKLDPPGDVRVTCCNTVEEGDPIRLNRIEWTGEEYGVAYIDENHPTDTTGDLLFQRLDASMSPVGDPVLVTDDTAKRADRFDLAWNGESYGVVWDNEVTGVPNRQVYYGTVGCNCTDSDGDNFSSCAGGDCDDGNPLVHPLAAEQCLDGVDNNCDGPIDCQDATACAADSGTVPGEVVGVSIGGDKATLSWPAEPDSHVYDLLTGDVADLRADGTFDRANCLAWRHPTTSYVDDTVPPPSKGRYYLVRGKADRCRLGTWGNARRDEARLTCP